MSWHYPLLWSRHPDHNGSTWATPPSLIQYQLGQSLAFSNGWVTTAPVETIGGFSQATEDGPYLMQLARFV
jgi:hypothetical protein